MNCVYFRVSLLLVVLGFGAANTIGQAPGVPVYKEGADNADLTNAVRVVRESAKAIQMGVAREQLRRPSCKLELLKPSEKKLTPREIYERARRSHLRIGWSYQCTTCDQWHLNLAGGYALTADGAIAASYHAVEPGRNMKQGFLIAVSEEDAVFPVMEVLAANRYSDACIVKVQAEGLSPLPLSTNVQPGDSVFCFSDPLGRRGYFSRGMVNRFFRLPERRLAIVPGAPAFAPTWMNVDTTGGQDPAGQRCWMSLET